MVYILHKTVKSLHKIYTQKKVIKIPIEIF